jgi:hypothetical protein
MILSVLLFVFQRLFMMGTGGIYFYYATAYALCQVFSYKEDVSIYTTIQKTFYKSAKVAYNSPLCFTIKHNRKDI